MTASSKENFLAALDAITSPVEGKPDRQLGQVWIQVTGTPRTDLKLDETEVYLESLVALERRANHGSEAMKQLINMANAYEITILLHPDPKDGSISPYDLRKFYRSFGFTRVGDNELMQHKAGDPAAPLPRRIPSPSGS